MLKVSNSSSIYHLCLETTQLFHTTRPSFPISHLFTNVAFDTTQPSSIRPYFACIFFTPIINPNVNAETDDSILIYKGNHSHTPEEAITGLLNQLRTEVGAKAREALSRRKPGLSRENWKGTHDLSVSVREERVTAGPSDGAGSSGGSEAQTGGAVASAAARLSLQEFGRPPSYGA